ncbi:MAG: hypothetical protein K0R17_3762 [Rariglobus sp.]|jgi:beta-xylosidase|nr:hypothetical protein [Rariglobus sp.]
MKLPALVLALLAPIALTHASDMPLSAPTPPPVADLPGHSRGSANPIIAGYYADPSLLVYQGNHYLYATLDPWGGETLGCWESGDFKNWTYRTLNWPTKQACTSPTSLQAKVWAPSVVRGADNRFYMYVSVGSEVWAGVADHPLGPWKNALAGKPLIPSTYNPVYHMIDAEAFIDTDGTAYLYWGSGWNWKNGRCFAVKLKPDMVTFDGEPRDVTPPNYFEGPFMFKHGGRYHLMYSSGKTTTETYQVHSAVSNTPFGPFVEEPASPVLVSDRATGVLSPGHHAVFEKDGRAYILYHRHSIPFDPKFIGRQLCVDELNFDADGLIEKVTSSHTGPAFLRDRNLGRVNLAAGAIATASSHKNSHTTPARALDENYATRWAATPDAAGGWLQLDLREVRNLSRQELRFEYAWKPCAFTLESSLDGERWTVLADHTTAPVSGSPVVIAQPARARHLRLVFPASSRGANLSVIDWLVLP